MNTARPGIPGRSAKSATDENGGSAGSRRRKGDRRSPGASVVTTAGKPDPGFSGARPSVPGLWSSLLVPVAAWGSRPGRRGRCRSVPRRRWGWRRCPLRPRPRRPSGCGGRWGWPPWPIGGPSAPQVVSPAVVVFPGLCVVVGVWGGGGGPFRVGRSFVCGGPVGLAPLRSIPPAASRSVPAAPLVAWWFRPGVALVARLMAGPAGRLPHRPRPVKGRDKRPTVGLWAALDRPGAPW